jgi:hypothetical protein
MGNSFHSGRGINSLGVKPGFVKGGSTRGKTANGSASKGGGDKSGGVSLDGGNPGPPAAMWNSFANDETDNPAKAPMKHGSGQKGSARGRSSNAPQVY